MECHVCGERMRVTDSRKTRNRVIRRRVCEGCGRIVFTEEVTMEYGDGLAAISAAVREAKRAKMQEVQREALDGGEPVD